MKKWIHRDIDFSECKHLDDMHEVIKNELELPDFYGRNLDALWDSITGIMATPAYVTIRGTAKLSTALQPIADKMVEIFRCAEIMYGNVKVYVEE
jgi:ribonuclease inhibitor